MTSYQLRPEWTALVRAEASKAEASGLLTQPQLELARELGWFRLLIPKSVGGLEWSLPGILNFLEGASWMDGSFGWVLALCGGAGFFAGFVELAVARQFFSDPRVCVAGTGFPAGSAEDAPGGYRVNGHWRYASGAPHATAYTANCRLINGEIRAIIMEPAQVTLENGWTSVGLKATASQDMIVKDAFIPAERTFEITKPFAHAPGPLYRFPFLQQAEAVLSVTLCGMARHYLDLFAARIPPKYSGMPHWEVEALLARENEAWGNARGTLYATVERTWGPYLEGRAATAEDLEAVGTAARAMTRTALGVTDRLYAYGGMEMMQTHSEINRVWRDIHTASQHFLLAPTSRE